MIEKNRTALAELCRKHLVRSLDLFGSAASDRFDPATSDLDFLVEFEDQEPVAFSAAYFGLLEELNELFACGVDLVVESPPSTIPTFARVSSARAPRCMQLEVKK